MSFDTSAAVTALEGLVAAIALIGAALLLPSVAKRGWKIVRSAI